MPAAQKRGGAPGSAQAPAMVGQMREKFDAQLAGLEKWISETPCVDHYVGLVSSKTGMRKSHVTLGMCRDRF